tara:strand:+ start:89 stop:1129 length:1041 start_codon:yes stop_codon:yes gene_type:complete
MFKSLVNKIFLITFMFLFVFSANSNTSKIHAQDIPELHMIVLQGDVYLSGQIGPSLDGYTIDAKIGNTMVGSVEIGTTKSSRYSGLEIGPNISLEGGQIEFYIGNEKANETAIFGPLTPSGTYCQGCTWSLPISRTLNLSFNSFPQATPTPIPASVTPSFITGDVIFGSMLSSPEGLTVIEALIDGNVVGRGEVIGSKFSITVDPGNELFLNKDVFFKMGIYTSKTSYKFQQDEFVTDYKLFFPEYVPPTVTPTPAPVATAVPMATSTPEPTRTPTPVPEPTPTYTPTPTPTPIVLSSGDSSNNDLVLADSSEGGCNSRGGGPASVSLILLSLVPAYVLKRKKRII